MSKLSDDVAELEAAMEAKDARIATLERQVERQKGAIEEGRGREGRLLKQLEESCELNGTYQTHFHTFHGSAGHVAEQEKALAAASAPPAIIDQSPSPSLMDKISRLGWVIARDEKATNGAAH